MSRHLIDSTGMIPTRDYREQLPKRKKNINVEEVERKNAIKDICLDCDREECSGNCKLFRTKRNANTPKVLK